MFLRSDSADATGEWHEIVVEREHRGTTLECIHTEMKAGMNINWMVRPPKARDWKLVLSASELQEFSGGVSKPSMRLADPNYRDTGNFSLFLQPATEDAGLYMCMIEQLKKKIKEKIILLAIITVTSIPASPIPLNSTLRLIAKITPNFARDYISWESQDGTSLKTVFRPIVGFVTKLPQATYSDAGSYKCTVHPPRSTNGTVFTFSVNVTVDDSCQASFTRVEYSHPISTATQARTSFPLTCPPVPGDYVFLYWKPPNSNRCKLLYQYDRWRGKTSSNSESFKLQMAGAPYNGSFSFIRTPGLKDGGLYVCKVVVNDHIFGQTTVLSVLKVMARRLDTVLQLECVFSEVSQVQNATWEFHNKSRSLWTMSSAPGNVTTTLLLPIASDSAGNYTCTLQLKDGQTVSTTYVVKQAAKTVPTSSPHSSFHHLLLLVLLLLVPLVAASIAVLLWRQKRISLRGIEQSLSVYSGETENIYENPEDVRQAFPPGSVYMDLKPRQDDVYKELEH
ncbi:g6f-like isoform X1 [Syngnathoides biaculeatus]|uniref:g6f-like isoform X1 n=1 Tax=Syngnathoides biaculeatus TaxID=300417 RepID=UPI002ADD61EC|nr:g6f-like isoform X1 [Syngnathoides biaculeatus]